MPKLRGYGSDEEGDTSPEGLLISALLEIGDFDPGKYHVGLDDVAAWRKLWIFAAEYQAASGVAPPLSLVAQRFPDFTLTPSIDPTWAAYKLSQTAAGRLLRTSMHAALTDLADDDIDSAYEQIERIRRPAVLTRAAVSLFDHVLVEEEMSVSKIEVPWISLGRATGGIAPAELWFFAARLGAGKSWVLCQFAALAAQCGYHVGVASLEMSVRAYAMRLNQVLCGRDTELLAALRSQDPGQRKEVVDHLMKLTPGSVSILDPSFGRIATTASVASMARDYDLVIIDHVGLLQSSTGNRAIEDWRTMATISNVLREITLDSSCPILGAAQVNREGERHGSSRRPPKASTLAQSDALGQDADVVITAQRNSDRVLACSAEKVRNGPGLRWYTRFQPADNRWEEISHDSAMDIELADEARKVDQGE